MPPFHVPLLTIDFGSAQATAIGLPAIVALVVIAVVGTVFVLSRRWRKRTIGCSFYFTSAPGFPGILPTPAGAL